MLDIDDILIFIRNAEHGAADAQYNLGLCYDFEGEGDVLDLMEAEKWYRRAAEQGHADAQNNLGLLYDDGECVGQNYTEAIKWFRKAAEQGHAAAQYNLGYSYEDGEGVAQNYLEAVKWYKKAAEQGHTSAQTNLANCYENGRGVIQNYSEAIKWYKMAANEGDLKARDRFAFLISKEIKHADDASDRYDNYNSESILKIRGYSVSKNSGLTYIQRQKILEKIIDDGELSPSQMCQYFDWFIETRSNKAEYKTAIEKWKLDKEFIIKKYKKDDD